MYNDNKYQHVCTNEISYRAYFKNKRSNTDKQKRGKNNQSDNNHINNNAEKQQNLKHCVREKPYYEKTYSEVMNFTNTTCIFFKLQTDVP